MKRKSKIEIIKETVKYIKENGRAVNNDDQCVYKSKEGKQCALGRCIDPRKYNKDMEGVGAYGLIQEHGQSLLKPEYRGHDEVFWTHLQRLHDTKVFWEEGVLGDVMDLSQAGKRYRDLLIFAYKEQ